jgi:hypothetical protein
MFETLKHFIKIFDVVNLSFCISCRCPSITAKAIVSIDENPENAK